MKDYKAPKIKVPFKFGSILMFLRCVFYLGLEDIERFQFWKLLWWALFRRPDLLPMAIYFAVEGYHFRKVSEMYTTKEPCQPVVLNK